MSKAPHVRWPRYRCRRCNQIFEATPEMLIKFPTPAVRRNYKLRCPPCHEATRHRVSNPDGPPKGVAGHTSPGSMYPMDRMKKERKP